MIRHPVRTAGLLAGVLFLAACAAPPAAVEAPPEPPAHLTAEVLSRYGVQADGEFTVPAVPTEHLTPGNLRQIVSFRTPEPPGTVIVDPWTKYLYFALPDAQTIRYRVAVGDEGRAFAGRARISYTREWPSWRPTDNMSREFPDVYGPLRKGMEGGVMNPLGARALYLHRNGKDTFYRIHGTSDFASVGEATSAGCIRLFHQDVIELERLVRSGAAIIVLKPVESQKLTREQPHLAVLPSSDPAPTNQSEPS